jgi:hypothetical protein
VVSRFLERIVARTRGDGKQLRPVINRWSISRASDLVEATVYVAADDAPQAQSPEASLSVEHKVAGAAATAGAQLHQQSGTPAGQRAPALTHREPRNEDRLRPDVPASPAASKHRPSERRPVQTDRNIVQPARQPSTQQRAPRLLPAQPPPSYPPAGAAQSHPSTPRIERVPDATYIHIGRIDVRAVDAPAPKPPPARSAMPRPTLEAHLRARDRDRS